MSFDGTRGPVCQEHVPGEVKELCGKRMNEFQFYSNHPEAIDGKRSNRI